MTSSRLRRSLTVMRTSAGPTHAGSLGGSGLPPAPAEVGLHEVVELAVEDGVDVAGLVTGAVVLDRLIGGEDVMAEGLAPADLGLGAGDGVELRSALLALP